MKLISSALMAGLVGALVVEGFPASIEGFYTGAVSIQDFFLSWAGWAIFSAVLLFAAKKD